MNRFYPSSSIKDTDIDENHMNYIAKLLLLLSLILSSSFAGCHSPISLKASNHIVHGFDRYPLSTYVLTGDEGFSVEPRSILFYIQGSSYKTVLNQGTMHTLASSVALGSHAIIVEKRGITQQNVLLDTCYYYAEKSTRVNDHLAVIEAFLKDADTTMPVILIGGSEGGDVAAAVAEREERVTHLILLGTGGGWSQEEELRKLIEEEPGYLGLKNRDEYDSIIVEIKKRPTSLEMWAGHPFKRWSSYLFDPPIGSLIELDIPIFLAHGSLDKSVPVGSAQAVVKAFEGAGKHNLTYREYNNANHSFVDETTDIFLYPLLEIDIVEWLSEHGVLSESEKHKFIKRVKGAHPEVFDR